MIAWLKNLIVSCCHGIFKHKWSECRCACWLIFLLFIFIFIFSNFLLEEHKVVQWFLFLRPDYCFSSSFDCCKHLFFWFVFLIFLTITVKNVIAFIYYIHSLAPCKTIILYNTPGTFLKLQIYILILSWYTTNSLIMKEENLTINVVRSMLMSTINTLSNIYELQVSNFVSIWVRLPMWPLTI